MVMVAIWVVRPGRAALGALGYLTGLVALVSIVIAVVCKRRTPFRTADGLIITMDKTLLPLGILVGIFTHGNNLGQFLALGLPAAAMIRRRSHRVLALAVICFGLVWTASRSALFTLGLVIVATGILSLVPPARRGGPVRLALIAAFSAVILVRRSAEIQRPSPTAVRSGQWRCRRGRPDPFWVGASRCLLEHRPDVGEPWVARCSTPTTNSCSSWWWVGWS